MAPEGNQFWKLRSSHGREKLFSTPGLLLKAAYEYFEWCDNNPWQKTEQLKKPISIGRGKEKVTQTTIQIPTSRPYTLSGLCIYLGVNTKYFNDFKDGMKGKEEEGRNKDFSEVISRIENIIYTQKFEGAAVGAFNANIIARDLGLTDKTDVTTKGKEISGGLKIGISLKDLSPELRKQLIDAKRAAQDGQ